MPHFWRNDLSGPSDARVKVWDNAAAHNVTYRNFVFQIRRATHFEDYGYSFNPSTGLLTGQGQLLRVNFEAKADRPVIAERVALEYLDPASGQWLHAAFGDTNISGYATVVYDTSQPGAHPAVGTWRFRYLGNDYSTPSTSEAMHVG